MLLSCYRFLNLKSTLVFTHVKIFLDDKAGTAESKNSKDETSSKDSQAGQRAASGRATGFPANPFHLSAMSGLLNVCHCLLSLDI